jgi:xanthine dehydrogenase YagS FAD-binding subunit
MRRRILRSNEAYDATVDIVGSQGPRNIPFAALHRKPGDAPDIETTLKDGEIIVGFLIPAASWTRRSLFLKVRDRASYEFALASVSVIECFETDGGVNYRSFRLI